MVPRRGVSPFGCCCRRPHAGRRSGVPAGSSLPSHRGGDKPSPGASQRSGSSSRRGKDSPRSRQYATSSFARVIRSLPRAALIRRQPPAFDQRRRQGRSPRLQTGGEGRGDGGVRPSAGERRQLRGEKGRGRPPSLVPPSGCNAAGSCWWPRWLLSPLCSRQTPSQNAKHIKKKTHQKTTQHWRRPVAAGCKGGSHPASGDAAVRSRVDRAFLFGIQSGVGRRNTRTPCQHRFSLSFYGHSRVKLGELQVKGC